MTAPVRTPAQQRVLTVWRNARRVDGLTPSVAATAVRRYFETQRWLSRAGGDLFRAADVLATQIMYRELARKPWTR